jgi:ABC-type thiamin/hydroxymethylpyrimidine transport system permease subunit
MSNLLISIMFGAGVSAFVYSRFGRRLGYANSQNQVILCAVVFILVSIIFFTVLSTIPK